LVWAGCSSAYRAALILLLDREPGGMVGFVVFFEEMIFLEYWKNKKQQVH
jgi:hypothetical protein